MEDKVMMACPRGAAVCDTLSLTSRADRRTLVSGLSPSLIRKLTVLRKHGLLLLCNEKEKSYINRLSL